MGRVTHNLGLAAVSRPLVRALPLLETQELVDLRAEVSKAVNAALREDFDRIFLAELER
jgi:hypothetical protein